MNRNSVVIFLCFWTVVLNAQDWSLRLKSSVELRTFKLTNKVDVSEEKLPGASITLYKVATIVSQMQSDAAGDFLIDVPAKGDFILIVSYPGCNPKKFAISTMGVPDELAKDNYKPTFGIEGVIMAKAFPTINYSILQQPLVRIAYTPNGKKFDDDDFYTNQMLAELTKIREAENVLMNNFTSTNNTGDVALNKGDCPLAKASYEKAMTIIAGERYPSDQLPKVGDCLKQKELADKKAKDEEAAKLAADKLAAEKAEAERLAKEKAAKEKIESDRLAKEKLAQETLAKTAQAEAEKAAKEKQENDKKEADRLAKEKAAQEKVETDKLAKDKIAQEKAQKEKIAKEKLEAGKLAKEKAEQEKIAKSKETPKEPVKEKVTTPVKETTSTIPPSSSGSESGSAGVGSGEAKYSIPQALGADKYKATIKRADELFKMKRYAEAKPMYEEALKQKPNDTYATNKLLDIEKLNIKK